MPMRTGLRDEEVPLGLRLAGVTTGYRQGGSYGDCLWGRGGLFTWHNQTLNSWTMIWGWMLSTALLRWTLLTLKPTGLALVAFVCLWLTPTLHLPFTVGYHQFLCMSPYILRRWRALDVIFIFVASVPLTFALAFFVVPLPAALGLTGVTLGLALHAWHHAASLKAGAEIDKGANTRYVGYVVIVYTFPILLQAGADLLDLALDADGLGLGHAWRGGQAHDRSFVPGLAAAVAFSFVHGAATYVASFPDVWAPGRFDLVGAAQQHMHVAIVGTHALEWLFLIHMFQRKRAAAGHV
ncbi:hypothetical protein HYH03_010882 [Edaphochlamys debaryana]|uniref:Uncharacterized protein n=1 Tax=Edaphochlamys debaryana TaxID=47281 RepID=A0A835XV69_9CHLO|nr:hypothetical protein HYH03_010882 [Edaphochlamys debaryana]|eukprot:KAG2490726.1 hypothetical protein HYH03_010882 [Edaphochlamys debaryana]